MRYNIGFMLGANISAFRSGMRGAAAEVRGFERVQNASLRRLQRAQAQMARQGTAITSYVAGIYSLVAGFNNLVEASSKFDYQARGLAAVMKASVGYGKQFHKTVLDYNTALKEFNPEEITAVARALSQAGYDMKASGIENVSAVLNTVTASLGALGVQEAVELGVNLERGFGNGKRSMQELIDVAVEGSNMFPMTLDKISTSMGYATESAVSYGQSLESVVVSLGVLMPVVKTASKAGVAYRNTLAAISRPFTTKFLRKEGIKARDSEGNFRNIMDIMADIFAKTEKIRAKDAKTGDHKFEQLMHKMFGIRGKSLMVGFQKLVETVQRPDGGRFDSPLEAYNFIRGKLNLAGGASERLAAAMRLSTEVINKKFIASLTRLETEIGEKLSPIMNDFKQMLTGMIDAFLGTSSGGKLKVRPGFKAYMNEVGPKGKTAGASDHPSNMGFELRDMLAPALLTFTMMLTAFLTKALFRFGRAGYTALGAGTNAFSSYGSMTKGGPTGGYVHYGQRSRGHRLMAFLGGTTHGYVGAETRDSTNPKKIRHQNMGIHTRSADGKKANRFFGRAGPNRGGNLMSRVSLGALASNAFNVAAAFTMLYAAVEASAASLRAHANATFKATDEFKRDSEQRQAMIPKAIDFFLKTMKQGGTFSKEQIVEMKEQGIFGSVAFMNQMLRENMPAKGSANYEQRMKEFTEKGGLITIGDRLVENVRGRILAMGDKRDPNTQMMLEGLKRAQAKSREKIQKYLRTEAPKEMAEPYMDTVIKDVLSRATFERSQFGPELLDATELQKGHKNFTMGKKIGLDKQIRAYMQSLRTFKESGKLASPLVRGGVLTSYMNLPESFKERLSGVDPDFSTLTGMPSDAAFQDVLNLEMTSTQLEDLSGIQAEQMSLSEMIHRNEMGAQRTVIELLSTAVHGSGVRLAVPLSTNPTDPQPGSNQ